jgi:hypothetical protein
MSTLKVQVNGPQVNNSLKTHCEKLSPSHMIRTVAPGSGDPVNSWMRKSAVRRLSSRSSPVLRHLKVISSSSKTRFTDATHANHPVKSLYSTPTWRFSLSHRSAIFQNLSADEFMFVSHIYLWGLRRAKLIAAKFHYKLRQPLPVLLGWLSELDKSYTKQSAKTRSLGGAR